MMEERILDIMRRVFQTADVNISTAQSNCKQWDSISQITLVVELEMAFDITFEPEEIAKMTSFEAVAHIVNLKVNANQR